MSQPGRAIVGARIFDGSTLHDGAALLVADGRVEGIVPCDAIPPDHTREDLGGGTLAPGFIDLQVNGGGGVMFNDAPTVETLRTMAEAHASLGTTALLPTLITDTPEITRAAIAATSEAIRQGVPGIVGLHLEGPHLSIARKGAHDPSLIRAMTDEDEAALCAAAAQLPVLLHTCAPESVTPAQMRRLADAGILVSIGHSNCTFEAARTAAESGARCVTHLFNAMSPLGHRDPGVVGAALRRPDFSAGLIADFVHVHPDVVQIALAAKVGPGQIFLVTDAMAPAGTDQAEFTLNARTIRRENGRLTLADGTLAGADLDFPTAISNLLSIGVAPAQALAMATSIPAGLIGAPGGIGTLMAGAPADLVHLDPTGRLLSVWRRGQVSSP
ncbi:N-acetylglucosamine 6-phosphate deacetylase [Aliiruegeria haliotis]|uniref:N-acetylglucosamine 6-phosphate deacetylase n=1 Tax=Aliiruegeria haliotis TaxID=1280846 RepID=A0A2T0RYT7_9RHOB|nr:N-acetylglucosamine-6-phosphate deacetylase [Aliiruegeria haliotis]PRY26327.1 N-acetylglucosamine 6-phosphate deacetylase [Aliiruegeria haliotis]